MRHAWVRIPPLLSVARLYEDIAEACGVFRRPKTVGIALNTFHIKSDAEALRYVDQAKNETGLPVTDPVRFGVDALLDPVLSA